jgi:hypothetical protein
MAKWKREELGSFLKNKDEAKAPYIKFKTNISFKEGDIVSVETKKFKLANVQAGVEQGRLSEEQGAKMMEIIEKMPDFVIGDIVRLTRE